jgi:predicted nucleic acid-binding protein
MRYVLDTNIWIDISRGTLSLADTSKMGINIALAPPVIIELVRGVVKSAVKNLPEAERCSNVWPN